MPRSLVAACPPGRHYVRTWRTVHGPERAGLRDRRGDGAPRRRPRGGMPRPGRRAGARLRRRGGRRRRGRPGDGPRGARGRRLRHAPAGGRSGGRGGLAGLSPADRPGDERAGGRRLPRRPVRRLEGVCRWLLRDGERPDAGGDRQGRPVRRHRPARAAAGRRRPARGVETAAGRRLPRPRHGGGRAARQAPPARGPHRQPGRHAPGGRPVTGDGDPQTPRPRLRSRENPWRLGHGALASRRSRRPDGHWPDERRDPVWRKRGARSGRRRRRGCRTRPGRGEPRLTRLRQALQGRLRGSRPRLLRDRPGPVRTCADRVRRHDLGNAAVAGNSPGNPGGR